MQAVITFSSMNESSLRLHGIKPLRPNPSIDYINEIKQTLFLFDTVGVTLIERLLHHFTYTGNRTALTELLGLQYQNLIFETHQSNVADLIVTPDGQFDSIPRPGMEINLNREGAIELFVEAMELKRLADDTTQPYEVRMDAGARVSSFQWNHVNPPDEEGDKDEFYPLITPRLNGQLSANKEEVYKIIIDKFPIPHPETPIEHLLEFRENPDNKLRLSGIKTLINDMAGMKYSKNEINQKLEHLINTYDQVLNKEKIKKTVGIFESGITTAIDPSFFSGKTFYKIVKSTANFFASEKPGPGYEISYLIKAHSMFNPQQ